MSKLENALKKLTPEQRALLEMRLKKKRAGEVDKTRKQVAIAPRANPASYPLSPNQERILFLDELSGGQSNYVITEVIRLKGPIELSLLEGALESIMERHESLRASFEMQDGAIIQTIHPAPYTDFRIFDLSYLENDKRLPQALEYIHQERKYPINTSTDCLVRFKVIRIDANDHFLVVSMHHAVSDGISIGIFLRELVAFYNAASSNQEANLPELPIAYADYAVWMNTWLKSEAAEKQRAFWGSRLESLEELQVPMDLVSPALLSFKGHSQSMEIDPGLASALQSISSTEKITPFVLFLSAFKITLQRFSQQENLVVCSTMSGRRHRELEDLVGYFNNLVAIPTRITDTMSLRAVINAITDFSMEANDNQELPFQQVAEIPSLLRTPLTRAFFTFEDSILGQLSIPGVEISPFTEESGASDFYLSLFVRQKEQLEVLLEYRTDLFSPAAIDKFLKNYLFVLNCLVEDLDQPLSNLPVFQPLPKKFPTEGDTLPAKEDSDIVELEASNIQPAVESLDQELVQQLQDVWASVMGLKQVGVYDNFFEIGGHSLLAVKLFARLEKEVDGFDLPLSSLLSAPTIARMSLLLQPPEAADQKRRVASIGSWSPVVDIQRGRNSTPLFCVHGAGGNILLYRDLAIHLGPHQTVYGLQAQGLDGKMPPLETIEEMATSYIRAIRQVQPTGPYRLLGYCMGGTIALEMAQQLKAIGEEVELLALLETYNWFHAGEYSKGESRRYYWQKIEFHFRNFMLLPYSDKKLFFKEKWVELVRRSKMWIGQRLGSSEQSAIQRALAAVWKQNDDASMAYEPRKYPGRLLHFKPQKDYAIHEGAELNWQGLAREIETYILPVYPAGMLVPPFVSHLAKKLREEFFALQHQENKSKLPPSMKTSIVADLVSEERKQSV